MPKAKPIDRVALTLRNSPLLQRAKSDDEKKAAFKKMMRNADIEHVNAENFDGVQCPYCS